MRHIGLLRGVNVGGNNMVAMRDLVELAGRLGLREARTLLQSGNLIFDGDGRSAADLERALEAATRRRFDLEIAFMVRTAKEWQGVIGANPFPKDASTRPKFLMVMSLKDAPARAAVSALEAAITGPEVVHVTGRHAYFVYPDGVGNSRLTTALIEKKLGTRGTARNWNTVLKLAALIA